MSEKLLSLCWRTYCTGKFRVLNLLDDNHLIYFDGIVELLLSSNWETLSGSYLICIFKYISYL